MSRDPDLLLNAALFTTGYVRLFGQEPAPSKCVLLSTSRGVRKSMKGWTLSDGGDKWSVKFDVRDLGGHLDTTFRGWSSTLTAKFRLVISRLVWSGLCIFLLHCMVFRLLFLPLTACVSFGLLFTRLFGLVVSLWLMLVLSLACWMGPLVATPSFCVVWFRFRLLREYLALWPAEVARVYRLLDMVGEGCPGHGPVHLLSASAAEIGFTWNLDAVAWFAHA